MMPKTMPAQVARLRDEEQAALALQPRMRGFLSRRRSQEGTSPPLPHQQQQGLRVPANMPPLPHPPQHPNPPGVQYGGGGMPMPNQVQMQMQNQRPMEIPAAPAMNPFNNLPFTAGLQQHMRYQQPPLPPQHQPIAGAGGQEWPLPLSSPPPAQAQQLQVGPLLAPMQETANRALSPKTPKPKSTQAAI